MANKWQTFSKRLGKARSIAGCRLLPSHDYSRPLSLDLLVLEAIQLIASAKGWYVSTVLREDRSEAQDLIVGEE